MKANRFIQAVQEAIFFNTAEAASEYLRERLFVPFAQYEQEEFWIFLLNARYRLTHQEMVYRGTLNAVAVRPAELFRLAVRLNAWGIVVAHNHPSGDADPSAADLQVYRTLCEGGKLLGITVVDHLVIGCGAWISLHEVTADARLRSV